MSDIKKTIKITLDAAGVKTKVKEIKESILGISEAEEKAERKRQRSEASQRKDEDRKLSSLNKQIADTRRVAAEQVKASERAAKAQANQDANVARSLSSQMAAQRRAADAKIKADADTARSVMAGLKAQEAAKAKMAQADAKTASGLTKQLAANQKKRMDAIHNEARMMNASFDRQKAAIQRMAQVEASAYQEKLRREQQLAKVRASMSREGTIRSATKNMDNAIPKAQQDLLKYGVAANKAELAQQKLVRSVARLNADFRAGKISAESYRATFDGLIKKFNDGKNAADQTANSIRSMLGVAAAVFGMRELITMVDGYAEFNNRIRSATHSSTEFIAAQAGIVDIAKRTRTDLDSSGLLYLRLAKATTQATISQKEMLRVVETVSKAVQIGGSSAQEANGALRQFTQILSSGFITGFSQELNSIAEQTPGLLDVLTNGLRDVSVEFRELEAGGMAGIKILKTFSEQGIGDLPMLLAAISSQSEKVDGQFAKIAPTIAKASQVFATSMQEFIGNLDQTYKVSETVARGIEKLAENMDLLAGIAVVVAGFMASSLAAGLLTAGSAAITLVKNLTPIGRVLSAIPLGIAAISTAFSFLSETKGDMDGAASAANDLAEAIKTAQGNLDNFSGSKLSSTINTMEREINGLKESLDGLVSKKLHTELQVAFARIEKINDQLRDRPNERDSVSMQRLMDELAIEIKIRDDILAKLTEHNKAMEGEAQRYQDEIARIEEEKAKVIAEVEKRSQLERQTAANKSIQALADTHIKELAINKKYDALVKETEDEKAKTTVKLYRDMADKVIAILEEQRRAELDSLNPKDGKADTSERDAIESRLQSIIDAMKTEEQVIRDRYNAERDFINQNVENKAWAAAIISALNEKMIADVKALTQAEKDSIQSRIDAIVKRFVDEEVAAEEAYKREKAFIESSVKDAEEKANLLRLLDDEFTEYTKEKAEERAAARLKEIQETRQGWIDAFSAINNAVQGMTDFASAKSDIRQAKIDEELSTSKNMTEEERKTKEAAAKEYFERSKKMTLAGIAMQTSLAVMNALSDPFLDPFTRAANAIGAAATGAAQYARANAQQYNAPSPPSASMNSSSSNSSVQNSQTTITINAGSASAQDIAKELGRFINENDGIIINPDSAQGRMLSA